MKMHRATGPQKEAERALAKVLAGRHQMKPEVIKPDSVSIFEIVDMGNSWEEFGWRTFAEYGFHEDERNRAEKLGFVYEKKFLEVVPSGFLLAMKTKLNAYTEELEYAIKTCQWSSLKKSLERTLRNINELENLHWVHLAPVIPNEPVLNHDKAMFPFDPNLRLDYALFASFIEGLEKGILRAPGAEDWRSQFMYLKKYESEVDMGDSVYGSGEVMVRFHIDIPGLVQSRNIFFDPEGFITAKEYGNTFMVKGGIPVSCIDSWSIWDGDDPPQYPKSK